MTQNGLLKAWKQLLEGGYIDAETVSNQIRKLASTNPCTEIPEIPTTTWTPRKDIKVTTVAKEVFMEGELVRIRETKAALLKLTKSFRENNQHLTHHYPIVAGGLITKIMIENIYSVKGWEPDMDIFFPGTSNAELIALDIKTQIGSKVKEHKLPPGYGKNPNISLVMDEETRDGEKIQYIFNKLPREEMLNDFDFLHCRAWYDIFNNTFHISKKIYDAIINKKLIVQNQKNVDNNRWNKWTSRGFVSVNKQENIYIGAVGGGKSTFKEQLMKGYLDDSSK